MNLQRGFIPISLIMYGVAALVALAAIGTVIYKVRHWCNAACVEQRDRADVAEASIKAAQDRATAIALLWAGNVTREDTNAKQRDADRTARFAPIVAASRALPADVARTRFPAAAARVLDDAIRAGNANLTEPAREPAKEAGAAPAAPAGAVDVAGITAWGVDVAALYASCADQVLGWQAFYSGLQGAQQ
jgi:hypothetical protein